MWETTRHRISRRKLLRGIGAGTFLLSPFVKNRLADAAPAGNFFFIATPNGFVRSVFGGQGSGSSWTFKSSLAKLTPHKEDITVIRGLCNKTSSTFNSHEDLCKMLSMVHGGGDKGTVYAASFDHDLGKFLNTRPLTLGVPPGGSTGDIYGQVSWVGPGKADTKIFSPTLAHLEAFSGGIMPGGSAGGVDLLLEKRKSVLDFVEGDIQRLKGRLVGKDAENLDLYLTSIREIENKLANNKPIAMGGAACDPAGLSAKASAAERTAGNVPKFQAIGEVLLDIAATAMACGSRRVGTLVWQRDSGGINPVAASPGHHDVSHGAAPQSAWIAIDKWYADRFVYFVEKMKAVGALNNTIVVWGSGIAEEHNQNDMVFVLAGGKNLGIKLNQNIVYPFSSPGKNFFQHAALMESRKPSNKSLADLWVSVQKSLGLNKDTVGDAQWCSGGLSEIYSG